MGADFKEKTRLFDGFCLVLNCESELWLAFLALLLGQFLSAFFSVNENVVRITQVFFIFLPCFSVLAPFGKFKIVQPLKEFGIDLSLKLLREAREKFAGFGVGQS